MIRLFTFLLVLYPQISFAEDEVVILYRERAPNFMEYTWGTYGLLADRIHRFMTDENIEIKWQQVSIENQLIELEKIKGNACLAGRSKSNQLKKYGIFTYPYYQQEQMIAISSQTNKKVGNAQFVEDLLSNPNLDILLERGATYSEDIQQKIVSSLSKIRFITEDSKKIIQLLYENEFDYFFITKDVAEKLIPISGFEIKDFKFIEFKEKNETIKQYLLCNKNIDRNIFRRLNEAIKRNTNEDIFSTADITTFDTQNQSDIPEFVAYTQDDAPFNYLKEDKEEGFSVELIKRIFKNLNLSKEIIFSSASRGYQKTIFQNNHLFFSTIKTKDNEKLFKWIGPIHPVEIWLYKLKSSNLKIDSVKDLNSYSFTGILESSGLMALIEKGVKSSNIYSLNRPEQIIEFMKLKRADFVSLEKRVSNIYLTLNKKLLEPAFLLKKSYLYYAFNIDTPDQIISQIQKEFQKIKANKTYLKKLKDKYSL